MLISHKQRRSLREDVIIHTHFYLQNEGIQEIITIQACLDPNKQREDCEDSDRVKTSQNK
jgi:hypothetical protein